MSAPRPCSYTGCRELACAGGRCEQHRIASWSRTPGTAVKRVTGRRLQRERARLFEREPLCVLCKPRGLVAAATQRDHIIPLAEGGKDEDANIQGLCDACHREKTLAEALRGRAR